MRKLLQAMAVVGVLCFATSALAQMGQQQQGQDQDQQMDQQAQAQERQLSGKVLKADRNTVIIEYDNAAVPFQVQRDTEFKGVTSAQSLKEGQEVRASYELKDNRNVLKSLEFMGKPGTGGAGEQQDQGEQQEEQNEMGR